MKHIQKNIKHKLKNFPMWGLACLVVGILILTGCSATAQAHSDLETAYESAVQIPPEAQNYVELSQKSLAKKLGVHQDQIVLDSITEPATAKGAFVIKLVAEDQTYVYHVQDQQVSLVSGPVPTSSPKTVPETGMPRVAFDLNEAVAATVSNKTIPAVETSDQTPYWALLPEHLEISFTNYAQPDSQLQPKIYVYPVADLKEKNQAAEEQISALEQLLIKKPDLSTISSLPFLPLNNAQAMFYAQVQYINFNGGSGIRYLTQHAQVAEPITNQELLYTFQGMTDDGKYYVAAIFPVAQSDLPADTASAGTSFPDGFDTYIQSVKSALEVAAPGSFNPTLGDLDDLIQTILIQY